MLGGIDRRPLVIVRPANADDVARVVALARETGLPLAVRSGGHSGAGHTVVDDGIVLDLRDMKRSRSTWTGAPPGPSAGLTAGGVHDRGRGPWTGDRLRGHGFGRARRHHARWRRRLSRAQARPDDRFAARGRRRDRRWPTAARRRRAPPGPVLGDPRRRRQLRRRDPVPVPAPPARVDRGRHADPAGHGRDRSRGSSPRPMPRPTSSRRSRTSCPARRCRSCPRSITASS